jgi:phage N-6-adenine-methyltransferase
MSEVGNADTIHGRLLEAIHISGYSLERAVKELEWLLEEERWRLCGPGYEEIDKFLAIIHLDGFTKNIEQRKGIVKKLSELRATQRAIGGALGVSEATVNRDINPVTDVTKTEGEARQDKELEAADVTDVTTPSVITSSGEEVLNKADEKAHVAQNAGNNEWYTPREYVAAARKVMGTIDLDPASTDQANSVVGADKIFTKETDGLEQSWEGCVWMNPPYAAQLIKRFAAKLKNHVERKDVREAVVLVNNATETDWFKNLIEVASAICFPQGRVKYWGASGEIAAPR